MPVRFSVTPLAQSVAVDDDAVRQLAAAQHGLVLRQQARTLGWTRHVERRRIERGEWVAEGPRLLRRAGAPWTKASPLVRAVLDAGPGAVLSHATAAAWWGLPGFDIRTIHVTRPRGVTSAPARFADRLHQVLDLSSDQVTVLDGVPIVRPERVAFELCATAHPLRAARAIDTGWAKGLFSGRSLRRLHAELAERGRTGTVVMRAILEERPDDYVPPATGVESRTRELLRNAGLGRFRRQVDIGDGDRWVGRVDFRHERLPLIVEVQSERYHTALCDRAADAARRAALGAAGFVVVEVWDSDVWLRADRVVGAVQAAIRNLHRIGVSCDADPMHVRREGGQAS
jgi:very-short-patch-repair endonuclease